MTYYEYMRIIHSLEWDGEGDFTTQPPKPKVMRKRTRQMVQR